VPHTTPLRTVSLTYTTSTGEGISVDTLGAVSRDAADTGAGPLVRWLPSSFADTATAGVSIGWVEVATSELTESAVPVSAFSGCSMTTLIVLLTELVM